MDIHTSLPTSSTHQRRPSGSGFSSSQHPPITSLKYTNPRSIYSNTSPATSRADSPAALLGSITHVPGATSDGCASTGPYRMVPGKPKARPPQHQSQPQTKVDILAPVPRRHLIDNTASSRWLSGQEEEKTLEYQPFPHSSLCSRKKPILPESPISPSSPLYSAHRQHTSANSSSFFRKQDFMSSPIPETASAGTDSLYRKQRFQDKDRSGSFGSPTGVQLPSAHTGHYSRRHHRHGPDAVSAEDSMGKAWIRWMHKRGIKAWIMPLLVLISILLKFCIGLGTYSGYGTPPMFGDYEAQRHWMELTLHLPFRQWYKYDLQYWGLDYPPLTAYVSWICGFIAHWINPAWVVLDKSRGVETETSKVFMRSTVVVWDMLVYVPALVMFVKTWQGNRSSRTQEFALLTLLFQPALLLVDFGHFQYNSVMLGLTLLAMNFFATGHDLIGAVFYVLSLGFKQMALYYAPAIGSYLLAKCLFLGVPGPGLKRFIHLGVTTVSSFFFLFLPFYLPPFAPSVKSIMDPITRIFPFDRGLFEDKVANFWCASNVVLKWRERLGRSVLLKLSAALTGLGFLPSVWSMLSAGYRVHLPLANPSSPRIDSGAEHKGAETQVPFLPSLPYALLTSSISFFLFSFQVHEKTILVPLLPMTLLLSGAPADSSVFAWGVLVNNIGVFSMWPLLKKDGLGPPYFVLLLLWNRMIGYNPLQLSRGTFVRFLTLATYTAAAVVHLLEIFVKPPTHYPDIYPVLNVLICTPVFGFAWLWSIKCGVEVGWAAGGLGSSPMSTAKKANNLVPVETVASSSSVFVPTK